MTWTRRDFQQLAGVLHRTRNAVRDSGSQADLDGFDRMVLPAIVRQLANTNTRFDPMRFTQADETGEETT